jgi:hypothetical protein
MRRIHVADGESDQEHVGTIFRQEVAETAVFVVLAGDEADLFQGLAEEIL